MYRQPMFSRNMYPSFINVIKPKKTFTNMFLQNNTIKSVENIVSGAQKVIKVYDQAMPIINQMKPMIGNIKTTFKVAKAFKKFSKESPLEKAFDNLPDFNETVEEETHNNKKVTNPFYP